MHHDLLKIKENFKGSHLRKKSINDIKSKELEKKLQELKYHDELYFNQNTQEITDGEYDRLKEEYRKLKNDLGDDDSHAVGYDPDKNFDKHSHITPMLSLRNVFNDEKLLAYFEGILRYLNFDHSDFDKAIPILDGVICEEKIDGVSFALHYSHGKLIRGLTRGNGEKGEDITHNIVKIDAIPKTINTSASLLEVRGELFFKKNEFIKHKDKFSNARNAVAGIVRNLNDDLITQYQLSYFVYYASGFEGIKTQENLLLTLEALGFQINKNYYLANNFKEITNYYKKISKNYHDFEHEIDGIVYKINSLEYQSRLGNLKDAYRWGIAYKLPDNVGQTTLENVIFQISRHGTITPVAELKPINIGGAMISRASLHNFDYIIDNDFQLYDTVIIKRAGEVIPKIISSIHNENSREIIVPLNCHGCHKSLSKQDKQYRCLNSLTCVAQIKLQIVHFASQNAFNIVGLSEKTISTFIDNNIINNAIDIFNLKNKIDQIKEINGFGDKSINKLLDNIEKSCLIPIENFIFALGIEGVGIVHAKTIAKNLKSVWNILSLRNIDSIGQRIASNIRIFIKNHHDYIIKLFTCIKIKEEEKNDKKLFFYNKKIAITGKLETISRQELKNIIEKQNGIVANSINKNTDYLICNIKLFKSTSKKYQEAISNNIAIIDEYELKNRNLI